MDHQAFDGLTRSLTDALTGSTTRRGITRLLGGLALGGPLALLGLGEAGAKCKKKCGPCKRCKKGKCKPKPAGTLCARGSCQRGTCIPAAAPAPSAPAALTRIACSGANEGNLSGARRLAQTFVANGTGAIATAEVEFELIQSGTDFLFEIRTVDQAGLPTATVLSNVERNDLPAGGRGTKVTATFIPAAPVTRDTTYALVLTDVSASGFQVHTRDGDCAGTLFADPQANGGFFPLGGTDLIFSVAP